MHERLHEPDLLPVALRELADRPVEHDAEAVDERVPHSRRRPPPRSRASDSSCARPVSRSNEAQVARQVADRPPRRPRRLPAVSRPKHARRPAVGRIRSSRRRIVVLLPAPFGPRNPKTSPCSTRRSSSASARTPPPIRLREGDRLDRGLVFGHARVSVTRDARFTKLGPPRSRPGPRRGARSSRRRGSRRSGSAPARADGRGSGRRRRRRSARGSEIVSQSMYLASRRARAAADVAEPVGAELGRLEALPEEVPHHARSSKNSIPQSVWWITNHSRVPSSL